MLWRFAAAAAGLAAVQVAGSMVIAPTRLSRLPSTSGSQPRLELPEALADALRDPWPDEDEGAGPHGGPRTPSALWPRTPYQEEEPLTATTTSVAVPEIEGSPLPLTSLRLDRDYFVKLAGAEGFLIVSWTTSSSPDSADRNGRSFLALNLGLSIRANAPQVERHFVFLSLDREAHRVLSENGFNSALCEAGTGCRSEDIKDNVWKMRWLLMYTLTGFGLSALVVDADIVFLADPRGVLWHDSDMEVMTDHFFPEKHLWEPWVRVEDHINTGFVLVRPSRPLRAFILDFLLRHWEKQQGHALRDAMDQRVFNHYVLRHMKGDAPSLFGRFENRTFGRRQSILPSAASQQQVRQLSIRILDPTRVAHGMNYFWRRAHLLLRAGPSQGQGPVVAHANGVDPKEYFLRDREVWFLQDWEARFGLEPRFLLYEHPAGLDLEADFRALAAALEVARLLGRRLVLPSNMNCRNSPAYRAWGLDESLQPEAALKGGCTFDYFSWAKHLLEVHGDSLVESSARNHEAFQLLREESTLLLPPRSTWPAESSSLAREFLPTLQEASVLEVAEAMGDVRDALLEALQEALQAPLPALQAPQARPRARNSTAVHRCAFQQFPHQVSVCRDERYVGRFGKGAQCDPYEGQAACGLDGFTCCMAFWGFSEKLEIFTGARWDLPCNCGLGRGCSLTRVHDVEREHQQYQRHCCADMSETSPREHCMLVPHVQETTLYGDSHFYSSYLLLDFLEERISPAKALEKCQKHRAGTLLDSQAQRADLHCTHLLTSFALWHRRHDRAFRWLEYTHWARRRNRTDQQQDSGGGEGQDLNEGRLRHDLAQMQYLSRRPWAPQVSPYAPLLAPELAKELAELHSQLLSLSLSQHPGPGDGDESQEALLRALRPFQGRALHLPHLEAKRRALSSTAAWGSLNEGHGHGHALLDGALQPWALQELVQHFLEATVWYLAHPAGHFLTAQLQDGLHAELLLAIASELLPHLPRKAGERRALLDILAHKYNPLDSGQSRSQSQSPAVWTFAPRSAFAASANFSVILWTTSSTANLEAQGNGFEVISSAESTSPSRHTGGNVNVAYRQNRLLLLSPEASVRPLFNPKRWRAGYRHQRVDLWFLYS